MPLRRLVVLVLLALAADACAQETLPLLPTGAPDVQVFAHMEGRVVAVGEAFPVTFDAVGVPQDEEAERWEATFRARSAEVGGDGLALVRAEPVEVQRVEVPGGEEVLHLRRRVLLRAEAEGHFQIDALALTEKAASPVQEGYAYTSAPALYQAGRNVVPIVAEHRAEGGRRFLRTGSAFLAGADALVTSLHVVLDARRVRVLLPDGRTVTTRDAWGIDPARDVAVLHVPADAMREAGVVPLPLTALDETGPRASFTFGWPGGTQRSTVGRVFEGAPRPHAGAVWLTTNPVRPGDSGGPLLDAQGRVLGIVTSGSILGTYRDVLRQEVTVAADPRPALLQRLLREEPRRLHRLLDAYEDVPQLAALRLGAALAHGERSGDLYPSLRALRSAAQGPEGEPGLLFSLGTAYLRLGARDEAARAYTATLEQEHDHFVAAYLLGVHHLTTQRYAEAAERFEQAARHAPYHELAAFGMARAYERQRAYDRVEVALREVLRYDARFAPALYELARTHLAAGQEEGARALVPLLRDAGPDWAVRLERELQYPVLRPVRLEPLPRIPARVDAPR